MSVMKRLLLLLICLSTWIVHAQETTPPLAAVIDQQLTVTHPDGQSLTLPIPGTIVRLTWDAAAARLAVLTLEDVLTLYTATLDGEVTRLNTGELEAFPPAFTAQGDILYVAVGENRVLDPQIDYQAKLMRIAPDSAAQPVQVGTFSLILECDGGASTPMHMQYAAEAGLLGTSLYLQETPYGILHSRSCAGVDYALLDPATGLDTPIIDQQPLTRAALSAGGRTLAAARLTFNPPDHTTQIVLIDLATLAVTPLQTAYQPDQLAWGIDTALYYTARQPIADLMQTLSPEDQATVKRQAFNQDAAAQIELPAYALRIQQLDLALPAAETTVFQGEGFAVGRLTATAAGLYFSVVPNGEGWLQAILDGTVTSPYSPQARLTVPVAVYQLASDQTPALIHPNMRLLTLHP